MSRNANAPEESSREKLMQSAGQLFAEQGFAGVSVRDIANHAGVNSALVGYYFQGKEGLLSEVYTRHCEPLKKERAKLLTGYGEGGEFPTLEQVLDAFIRPSLQTGKHSEGRSFLRLRAVLSAENSSLLEQLVSHNFDDTNRLFVDAICKCLPDLPRDDVFWRFHFLLGAIYYTATGPYRIKSLSKGRCDPSDPVPTIKELIQYAAAGLRAPSLHRKKPAKPKPARTSKKAAKSKR